LTVVIEQLRHEAKVSKRKFERAKSDSGGRKSGIHTQMEVLEEGLYLLGKCEAGFVRDGEGDDGAYKPMGSAMVGEVAGRLAGLRGLL
jgi:hypothetical protein